MRNAMRRISAGLLGAGMVVALTAGVTAGAADAATKSPAVTPVQAAATGWPVVSPGASGERVRTIQYLLDQRGFKLTVDGVFGPLTEAAVQSFQSKNKITPTGNVGNDTWPKLVVTLKLHARGDAVRAVQRQLRVAFGHKTVLVDGFFGQKTLAALKIFQRDHKQTADGVVRNLTWKAMVNGDR